MFKEADGPTALRADLVRALCFSMDVVEVDGAKGSGPFCAGIGAVWNGNKGYVAILLRHVNKPFLRRMVADQPFTTVQDLDAGVDEAIAHIEAMGFTMDHPEFESLGSDRQKRRLRCWNDIRKVDRQLRHLEGDGERPLSKRRGAPAQARRSGDSGREEQGDDESDDGKNVLGRLALVRKEETARLHPLARLLSYF